MKANRFLSAAPGSLLARLTGAVLCSVFLLGATAPQGPLAQASGPDRRDPISAESRTNEPFAGIDTYIESQMKASRIPGVAFAIVQDDQVVHLRGLGVAGPSGRPMTPQTPMLIGSVSKSFTALAIMQLVEAGKVDLDAPVQRYLPWFQVRDSAASKAITIRQLLNQTSGFPESAGQRTLADGYAGDDALEREVRFYRNVNLTSPAGSTMQYSNANYNTLGMMVQAVSGQPYETYVQQHIFEPLGMTHSFTAKSTDLTQGLATGYRMWFGFPLPARQLPFPRGHIPSGYLVSSAEDLAHYLIAQLNDGAYQDRFVLSSGGISLLQDPSPIEPVAAFFKTVGCDNRPGARYAMGWWALELNQIPVICHSGDTPDFHADVVLIPEQKLGVVLLMNVSNKLMSEDIHGLIAGVLGKMMGQTPIQEKPDLFSRVMFFCLMGLLIFELAVTVRTALRLRSRQPNPAVSTAGTRPGRFRVYRPLVFSLAGAGLILMGMPLTMGYPLRLMLLNQPDFTAMLMALSLLILLQGALCTWLNGSQAGKPDPLIQGMSGGRPM